MSQPNKPSFHTHSRSSSLTTCSTKSDELAPSPRKFRWWQHGAGDWTVVWCHERCLLQECKELCKTFQRQAEEHGAELACLKKAHQFCRWLATAEKPYVLFTDWREVKGCNEAIAVQGLDGRPIFTSICCIDGKQQCRAERWVSTLPERKDPMYINRDLSSADPTLKRLLLQAWYWLGNITQVPSRCPLTQLKKDDVQPSCIVEGSQPGRYKESPSSFDLTKPMKDDMHALQRTEATLSAKKKVPVLPLPQLTLPKNGEQAHGVPQQNHLRRDDGPMLPSAFWPTELKDNEVQSFQNCQNKPTTTTIPTVAHADPQGALQRRVAAHISQIWASFSCPEEVEKALIAAMPEKYEE